MFLLYNSIRPITPMFKQLIIIALLTRGSKMISHLIKDYFVMAIEYMFWGTKSRSGSLPMNFSMAGLNNMVIYHEESNLLSQKFRYSLFRMTAHARLRKLAAHHWVWIRK